MSNNIEHLDFVSEDPVVKGGLEWMGKQGPVPEASEFTADYSDASVENTGESTTYYTARLEQAIDEKLERFYQDLGSVENWDPGKVKQYMRVAFGAGYEHRGRDNGQLQTDYNKWKSESEKKP